MVYYTCEDGSELPGVDRYATREEATSASLAVDTVVVSGDDRLVRDRRVVIDPARDPAAVGAV